MELTKQEKVFIANILRQSNFGEAQAKIFAGQLQLKIESSLQSEENQPEPED